METEKQPGKLLMLKGLPRSGKSTWAKEWIKKSGNWYRVNKDSLRTMLHDDKWTPQNEKITMKAQDSIVRTLLSAGKNVVVDDTNLGDYHRERWSGIAKEVGGRFETKEFTADIQTLVERDGASKEQRGRQVIEKLALQYRYIPFEKDEIVICDIDGTIADCEHRRHFVNTTCDYCGGNGRDGKECVTTTKEKEEGVVATHMKRDWDGFFSKMHEDTIIESTLELLHNYVEQGKKIIFVSARPEKYRKVTEDWLYFNYIYPIRSADYALSLEEDPVIPYEALLMRPDNDTKDDTIVKQAILDTYFDKSTIHAVIDDRPSVVRMWRDNGLEVIDVGDGEDF